MDRARKGELVRADRVAVAGAAPRSLVATHDVEFAAAFAERVVLLGDGEVIADGPCGEVLSGGWYFATEVARVLDLAGVITPEQGAAALAARSGRRRPRELAAGQLPDPRAPSCSAASPGTSARGRPSQVVALVAALAALAVAGRIAFAAIPNVKPTTDIVIFAGYALGGAPGFAVGALSALVSNFWFGQGPWTPWQMAGWGLVRARWARPARRSAAAGSAASALAAACGLAGVAYGALLNFSLMATYGGDLSLERFLALLEARAFPSTPPTRSATSPSRWSPGPAMVRMLIRFRERFEWPLARRRARAARRRAAALGAPRRRGRVRDRALAVAALAAAAPDAALAKGPATPAGSSRPRTPTAASAPPPDDDSSAGITGWAMLGLEAAGPQPARRQPQRARRRSTSCAARRLDLRAPATSRARSSRSRAPASTRATSRGQQPRQRAARAAARDNGSFEGWPNRPPSASSPCAPPARAAGPSSRAAWLRGVQNNDGGWGDSPARRATPTHRRRAAGAPRRRGRPPDGVSYLRRHQRGDGGFAARRQSSSQLAVDRLGGPGDDRRRAPTRRGQGGRQQRARLPRRAPAGRRPLPLLEVERPDAGLGHRPGAARRGRAQVVPDRRRARRAAAADRAPAAGSAPSTPPAARSRRCRRVRRAVSRPPLPSSGSSPFGAGQLRAAACRSPSCRTARRRPCPAARSRSRAAASRARPRRPARDGAAERRRPSGDIGGGSNLACFAIAAAVLVGVAALAFASAAARCSALAREPAPTSG